MRQLAVRHRHRVAQRAGEIAEAGAEHDRDLGNDRDAAANGVGRLLDVVVVAPSQQEAGNRRGHEVGQRAGEHRAQAEPRQIVTPVRREPADAADLHADRAEVREAAQRERRDRERLRIERRLERTELRVGDELVERHARAEQVADRRRIAPRHAHRPRDRREHPAEDPLEAQVAAGRRMARDRESR